ncbi:MAG: hypothetical protein ABFE13_05845 [Phycisphaerales bacterium]
MKDRNEAGVKIVMGIYSLLLSSALAAPAAVSPPDPNNAALLYYQAIMACPKPDSATENLLHRVLSGAEPDQAVKRYVEGCKESICLMEAAVRMPACDWNRVLSSGQRSRFELSIRGRDFASAVAADAHIQTLAGDYRPAMAQCLLMCRVAGHGHSEYPNPVAKTLESAAYRAIRHILGLMRPDVQTLTWFRHELTSIPPAPLGFPEAVKADMEGILQSIKGNDRNMAQLRDEVSRHADESMRTQMKQMTDEQVLGLVRQSQVESVEKGRRILESDLPYEEAYEQLKKLEEKIREQAREDTSVALLQVTAMQRISQAYADWVRHKASLQALQTALELYIEAARTGRLPRRLSMDWPRDPLTGEDFDYEVTKTGFILRSQDRDIPGDGRMSLEFGICDPNMTKQVEPWETGEPDAATIASPAADEAGSPTQSVPGARNKVQYRD